MDVQARGSAGLQRRGAGALALDILPGETAGLFC